MYQLEAKFQEQVRDGIDPQVAFEMVYGKTE